MGALKNKEKSQNEFGKTSQNAIFESQTPELAESRVPYNKTAP